MIADVSLSGLKPGEASDPKAVAAKVQSLFTEVMLKTMEESVDAEDGLFGSSASADIYRGMLNEHLAGSISAQMKSPLEAELSQSMSRLAAKQQSETQPAVNKP